MSPGVYHLDVKCSENDYVSVERYIRNSNLLLIKYNLLYISRRNPVHNLLLGGQLHTVRVGQELKKWRHIQTTLQPTPEASTVALCIN